MVVFPACCRAFSSLFFGLLLLNSCSWRLICVVSAGCDDDYNLDHHHVTGKLDICSIEDELPDEVQILINWGSRPEWIDGERFVFRSNSVGDVYLMDLNTNTVRLLTGHFAHSGFARVQALRNGDLLLNGPSSGPQPPEDPLVIYEEGRFIGDLYLLKGPDYDGRPVPLNVHAWEGLAVSRISNRIAWSDTNKPFFGRNIIETGLNYIFGRSNLWTGIVVYDDDGVPSITERTKILSKGWFNFVFYEPRAFKGGEDQELLFSAYGPTSEGSSDSFVYKFSKRKAVQEPLDPLGYNEWENIHPQYNQAFYERGEDATRFSGPGSNLDLWIWDFATQSSQLFSQFRRDDEFGIGNANFSPDGRRVLLPADSPLGNESRTPGYAVGVVLVDFESWQANPKVLR